MVEIKRKSLIEENHDKLMRELREKIMDCHDIALDQVILVKSGTIPKTTSGKIKRNLCE